jgi:ABC-type branched-subunit amino acid transport system ATPase component
MPAPLLVLRGVEFNFGMTSVLSGINLAVKQGEVCSIEGANGSGKSTLLKVVAGLLRPARGELQFQGSDLTARSMQERRAQGIIYSPQGGRLFGDLSVRENLILAARKRCCLTSENLEGYLAPLYERRARLLSGGQRHLVAFAMALARKGALLLLDEPFAGLAAGLGEVLAAELAGYLQRTLASLVIVEHRRDTVELLAPSRFALRCGRLDAI